MSRSVRSSQYTKYTTVRWATLKFGNSAAHMREVVGQRRVRWPDRVKIATPPTRPSPAKVVRVVRDRTEQVRVGILDLASEHLRHCPQKRLDHNVVRVGRTHQERGEPHQTARMLAPQGVLHTHRILSCIGHPNKRRHQHHRCTTATHENVNSHRPVSSRAPGGYRADRHTDTCRT